MWLDLIPVVFFFVAFKIWGIYAATFVAIISSVLLMGWQALKKKPITTMQWVTLGLIVFLGGATLLLHDEAYIKWKPTAVYWAFSLAFLVTHFWGQAYLIERMLDEHIRLPKTIWAHLNLMWCVFFTLMGALNVYVFSHFDTATWVNFKVFGSLGATVVFTLLQGLYMSRHIQE